MRERISTFFNIPNFLQEKRTLQSLRTIDKHFSQRHSLVVHEFLHVLGAAHEHNRPDRDDHVKVLWSNVGVRRVANFFKDQWSSDFSTMPRCRITNGTKQVGKQFYNSREIKVICS